MEFKDLFYHHFMQGLPIRRKGWLHYWVRRDFSTIEIINPYQGTNEKITDRDDIVYLLENIVMHDDWELADKE